MQDTSFNSLDIHWPEGADDLFCGCINLATKACDYAIEDGSRCDASLCGECAISPVPGLDICKAHVEAK